MLTSDTPQPSFSSGRRWLGLLSTVLAVAGALGLVVMLNYLAAGYFRDFQLSRDAAFKLSSQTRSVLASLTNDVQVTIFFQPHGDNEEIYLLTQGLLQEYQNTNPRRIHLQWLDYTRFVGQAKELLAAHNLSKQSDKDFVLFESNGHFKVEMARQLADYDYSDLMTGRSKFVRRSAFLGELHFTSDIYALAHPQTLKSYFLSGHGENNPGDPSGEPEKLGVIGYSKLAAILKDECDSTWDRLELFGTNDIPHDCQLLIVAGPHALEFLPAELEKIAAYLKNGGRLLALLTQPSNLESLLAKPWGVQLGANRVMEKDPKHSIGPLSFFTFQFNSHAIVNPLASDSTKIMMVSPRPIKIEGRDKIPGAPEVNILAITSKQAVDSENHIGEYQLLAAIEQGVIPGVDTPRGVGTRIVVAGDSYFLDDQVIDWPGNHEFAKLALDWLLQRPTVVVQGLGPRPIKRFSLFLTTSQSTTVRWLFLAGLPAAILALGGLVWLRRRH
ncbi:MAG TPA: Gldg family protein [Candidatus Cybelea sp.]|nr:Gldg family protein [Candidatus Cybelea sp.]